MENNRFEINLNDSTLREYVVTLKKYENLDDFYEDMETPGGDLYIPDRAVDLVNRRELSRNTHYMLSSQEAEILRKDARVQSVTLNTRDKGLSINAFGFTQISDNFSKATHANARDVNWGLLRCLSKSNIPNWGSDADLLKSATIRSELSGKNVDVVIMDDGSPYPNTLEFRKNSDGTGYTRVIEYPWEGISYDYDFWRVQEHNAHTAGTTAGNTQGWARDANIYSITFVWDTDAELGLAVDAVKLFHRNKPINPVTGLKNPTVMNNSWGYGGNLPLNLFSKIVYRGQSYFASSGSFGSYEWNTTILNNVRLYTYIGSNQIRRIAYTGRVDFLDEDFTDLINEGIIVVGSAGNDQFYIDRPGGIDYDNYILYGTNDIEDNRVYFHRGSSPSAAVYRDPNTQEFDYSRRVINVGSLGSTDSNPNTVGSTTAHERVNQLDYKSRFSNYGPRVDVYAPGQSIQSIWKYNWEFAGDSGGIWYSKGEASADLRCSDDEDDVQINNFAKVPGTSMSGPQVAGILACLAEKYPRMKNSDALAFIEKNSPEILVSTTGGTTDGRDAGLTYSAESTSRIMFFKQDRFDDNNQLNKFTSNKNFYRERPTSKKLYPRIKNYSTVKTKDLGITVSSNTNSINDGDEFTVTVNASVPNGTKIPYLITAKQSPNSSGRLVDLAAGQSGGDTPGLSGIFYDDEPIIGMELVDTRSGRAYEFTFNGLETRTGSSVSITKNFLGPDFNNIITPIVEDENFQKRRYVVQLPTPIKYLGFYYDVITVYDNSFLCFGDTGELDDYNFEPDFPRISISGRRISMRSGPRARLVTLREPTPGNYVIGYYGNTSLSTFKNEFISTSGGLLEWELHINNSDTFSVHIEHNEHWHRFGLETQEILPEFYSVPVYGTVTINNGTASLPITFNSNETVVNTTINFRLNYFDSPNVNIDVIGVRPFYRVYTDKSIYYLGDTVEVTLECTNVPDGTPIRWIGDTDFIVHDYFEVNGVGGDGQSEPSASYKDAIRGVIGSEVTSTVQNSKIVWRFRTAPDGFGEQQSRASAYTWLIEFPDIPVPALGVFDDTLRAETKYYYDTLSNINREAVYSLYAYNVTDPTTPITSASEGDTIVIVLETSNVPYSFPIPYEITGITNGDIDIPLTGEFIIQSTSESISTAGVNPGEDSITIQLISDGIVEVAESLTLTLSSPAMPTPAPSITISINDA